MLAFGTQLVRVQRLSHTYLSTYLCGVRRTCHLRLYVLVCTRGRCIWNCNRYLNGRELHSVISAPSVRVSAYSSQYIHSSFGPAAHHADALSERAVCTAAGHRSRPNTRRITVTVRTSGPGHSQYVWVEMKMRFDNKSRAAPALQSQGVRQRVRAGIERYRS